jgi:hypothetical protein
MLTLQNYVGRMLSSISVPMRVQDGRLSIEKLCDLAESHKRLKA